MRQFKTIMKFEFQNFTKAKSFIMTTLFFLILVIAAASIPAIVELFRRDSADDAYGIGAGIDDAGRRYALIVDSAGIFTDDILATYLPNYAFTRVNNLDNAHQAIEDGDAYLAFMVDGLNFRIYERDEGLAAARTSALVMNMIRSVYQINYLTTRGLSASEANQILWAHPAGEVVIVGAAASENFFLAYGVLFAMYMMTIMYGQFVSSSVITEKSSKAMELLVTSAKPFWLMLGKVIGVGGAGLAQFGLLLLTALVALQINQSGWAEFNPAVAAVLEMSFSPELILLAIIFFILGFLSFSFMSAAFSSTVSRIEEASSVMMVPMLLFVAAFMVAMVGLGTPNANYVVVTSFVPFLSPMVMFMRICLTDVPLTHIALAIAINIATVLITAFVSSRIYRVGVMMYGKAPNIKEIVKYIARG